MVFPPPRGDGVIRHIASDRANAFMTERSDHHENRRSNQAIGNSDSFAPDGGIVAVPSASPAPDVEIQSPEVGGGEQDNNIDPRTERALTEEMDVSLLRKGGVYEVKSQSGSYYEVDVASETCTCPDFVEREPDGGCKHLRRVDTEIREDDVPRPDGRLPDKPRSGESSDQYRRPPSVSQSKLSLSNPR